MAIASCLVDTNILLRSTRRADPQQRFCRRGIDAPPAIAPSGAIDELLSF